MVIQGRGRLLFVSAKEASGSAASEFTLFDGGDTGGQQCLGVVVPTSTTANFAVGTHGITYLQGLFFHVVTGSITGTLAVQSDFSDAEWALLEAAGLVP